MQPLFGESAGDRLVLTERIDSRPFGSILVFKERRQRRDQNEESGRGSGPTKERRHQGNITTEASMSSKELYY